MTARSHPGYALAILLLVAIASGCRSVGPGNRSEKPWNQPTRWELSRDWLFAPWSSWQDDPIRRGPFP
ncbi:MAG: hypothetical protein FJ387_10030 [Verrucomicrobia bacterium]|nr:hypothetical protein [Verrucomicrobiota bacterium]